MKQARRFAISAILGTSCVLACGPRPSKLPEPTYVEPKLPAWTPPEPEPAEVDPALLDGEWVTDEPAEPPVKQQEEQPDPSGKQQKVDFGMGGAQISSTELPRRARVRSPKSD